jgi:translocation and assembly module TamB
MVANLRPLSPGAGTWTTRLMAAPLSGGIRYNGPAGVLFSFAGQANQQLSGPIGIAADFGGRVQAPRLVGVVRANNLAYENESLGTRLTQMKIGGRFNNDRFELVTLTAKAGDGSLSAQGTVGLAADSGFPIDVRATLNKAQLARSDELGASASGEIRVLNNAQGGSITGQLTIPEARYVFAFQGASEVPELTGIRRKSEVRAAALNPQPAAPAAPAGLFKLDLRVRAPNQLYVSGMGLESEWKADLRVGGTSAAPRISGGLDLIRGTYSFAGKEFDVERGKISFEGDNFTNPVIDIEASTTVEDVTASIIVSGTAQAPRIAFTSTPALAQDEVLARLLFGRSVTDLSATEAIQLAAALNSLRGSGGGGLNPLGKLRSATGIDRLRILGSDEATGRGTALAAGEYLTDDIYIEIITDARGFTATQLEVALSKALSVLSQTGSFGGSNVSVRYSKNY